MKTQCLASFFLAIMHLLCASTIIEDEEASGSAFTTDQQERIHKDILDQVGFALRAGVDPVTVVTEVDGIRSIPNSRDDASDQVELSPMAGRGVIYLGEDVLPPGTTVALYRALLVRKDVLYGWIDDGTIARDIWQDFWKYYSVQFTSGEDSTGASWMAIPVGDAEKGPDEATWWVQGPLSENKFEVALISLNSKVLVDWRRLAAGDEGRYYLFNAHIINEPSAGGIVNMNGELLQDEKENIGHLHGSGCSGGLTYCGAVFEAKTSTIVQPGEQLLWCYGKNYARNYPVAQMCLTDEA